MEVMSAAERPLLPPCTILLLLSQTSLKDSVEKADDDEAHNDAARVFCCFNGAAAAATAAADVKAPIAEAMFGTAGKHARTLQRHSRTLNLELVPPTRVPGARATKENRVGICCDVSVCFLQGGKKL